MCGYMRMGGIKIENTREKVEVISRGKTSKDAFKMI